MSNKYQAKMKMNPRHQIQAGAKIQAKYGELCTVKNKFHLISGKEVVSFQKISTPGKLGETTVFFAVIPAFKEQKKNKQKPLKQVYSVHDPIDLISPTYLLGILICHEICDKKLPWDKIVSPLIKQKWKK